MGGKLLGDVAGFSVGQPVEVRMDDEGFKGAWYLAKVVKLSPESFDSNFKDKLFVVFDHLLRNVNEKGKKIPLREHVHVSRIRPKPLKEEDSTFVLGQEVDIYYHDGWWKGEIEKILEDSAYVVYLRNWNEKVEVEERDLRVHQEWINGQWVLSEEMQKQQKVMKLKNTNPSGSGAEFFQLKSCQTAKICQVKDHITQEVITSKMNAVAIQKLREPAHKRTGEQKNAESSKRVRLEPPDASPTEGLTSNVANDWHYPRPNISKFSLQVSPTSPNFSCITNKAKAPEDELSEEAAFEKTFSLLDLPVICNRKNATSENNEVHVQSLVADVPLLDLKPEFEYLPFQKVSSVWKMLQAMDIFQQLPQSPHFHPLKKLDEAHREGRAIGLMSTFSIVVENARNSKPDTPASIFEGCLKVLADLELHGFDVQKVRTCMEGLLKAKENYELFKKETESAKEEILRVNVKVEKGEAATEEVNRHIKEANDLIRKFEEDLAKLLKKQQDISMAMLDDGSLLTDLQNKLNMAGKNIRKSEAEFYNFAKSLW